MRTLAIAMFFLHVCALRAIAGPFDLSADLPESSPLHVMSAPAIAAAALVEQADLILGIGPIHAAEYEQAISQDMRWPDWAVALDWHLVWMAGRVDGPARPELITAAFLRSEIGRDLAVLVIDGRLFGTLKAKDDEVERESAMLRSMGVWRIVVIQARERNGGFGIWPPPYQPETFFHTGPPPDDGFAGRMRTEPDLRVLADSNPPIDVADQLWIDARVRPPTLSAAGSPQGHWHYRLDY